MAANAEDIRSAGRPAAQVRIANWAATPRPKLGPLGAQLPLDAEESAIVDTLRRFAEQEMRPLGVRLDRMTPDAVIAPDSPLWSFYAKFNELGCSVDEILSMQPTQRAYEPAHAYAHQRRQGGAPPVRHQTVVYRLFQMFRKVEAARALTRRAVAYNTCVEQPPLHAAMTAKITGTQTAFEVANEALQLFGGNGMTREYPLQKLLRDARASLIEDGCNEILALLGGNALVDPELL